ncbi:renin receptor-like [Physella acuta]|uniref:renin receptor-like n=1 Tax=Physella acuta TaxID=109671 RepID=UPI0027DDA57B|nr:renin receptor-like [Physella acuta]
MASTLPIIVLFVLNVLVVHTDGQQFHVKHAPPYVVFQQQSPDSPVSSSNLHNVLSGPLGLSRNGALLHSKSVLKRPKANVLITIVTHDNQNLPVDSLASYKLDWDVPFVDVEYMMNNLQSKFIDKDPLMLDIVSANKFFDVKTSSSLFESLPTTLDSARERLLDTDSILKNQLGSLNYTLNSDGKLLGEIQVLYDAVKILKGSADNLKSKTPDLLSFTFTGLKDIGEEYGVNSDQVKDATKFLTKHLDAVTDDLKSYYKGNVMIEFIVVPTVEKPFVRKTRSLMADVPKDGGNPLNLEIDWDQDFPASFNIVLWLMIVLSITVFFVAYGIWNMNPNLESILYRVPQDELAKKIN